MITSAKLRRRITKVFCRRTAAAVVFLQFIAGFMTMKIYPQELRQNNYSIPSDSSSRKNMTYRISQDIDYIYAIPRKSQFIKYAIEDVAIQAKHTFQRKNAVKIGMVTAATVFLVSFDRNIYRESKSFAHNIHLSSQDHTRTMVKLNGHAFFRGPTDIGSGIFFIGDGWATIGGSLLFLGSGLISNDYRAMRTASQLAEGLIAVGITTQAIKRSTGRETPNKSTAGGGAWRLFPALGTYQKNASRYCSFSSGHVATAMMSLTIIAENYPEHKFIRPLGYFLMGLLGYQMVNIGVHWMSDYPLALAIGYSHAKMAVSRGRMIVNRNGDNPSWTKSFVLAPASFSNGAMGLALNYNLK